MHSVLIAGSGGQGVLLAARVLAEAAMLGGKNVTWFPSYGAEMRGGTANATVVISKSLIGSPVVRDIDALMAMNAESMMAFSGRVREGGILLLDSSKIEGPAPECRGRAVSLPAGEIAGRAGDVRSANMVLLGALCALTGAVPEDSLGQALRELGARNMEINIRALALGRDYVADKKG